MRWSAARRWSADSGAASSPSSSQEGFVDANWLAAWEADRQMVTSGEHWLTQSHGMRVPHEPAASPPLARLHSGPWNVLPIRRGCAADAMQPFEWVAAQVRERNQRSSKT